MKMKFRLDRKSYVTAYRSKGTRKRVLLLVGILICLYIGGFVITSFAAPAVHLLGYPLIKIGDSINRNFPGLYEFFSARATLTRENTLLKAEMDKANLALLRLKEVENDNTELRARLGYRHNNEIPLVAKVVSKPDQNAYDIIVVDVGSSTAARIKTGNLVTVANTIALGFVDTVGPTTATVRLFSSAGVNTPVLLGPNHLPAPALGQGGGDFSITLPKNVSVAMGDHVTSTSTDNFILGSVGAITRDAAKPFQTILFRSPVNFINLTWVEIYAR
jgi:rod shape-determining protein MreC